MVIDYVKNDNRELWWGVTLVAIILLVNYFTLFVGA